MGQPLWAGVDAGKSDHYCVVIDADGKRLLSRRVANDEAALLELINAITALADGGELTWAIDLNAGGAALLIALLIGAEQRLLNPHLWYKPTTMPAVANAVATDLGQIDPAHAAYYKANAASFTASLGAWNKAMAAFKSAHPAGIPVATTEPVADYMLQAAGADNLTPWTFQADIMNGTDPSPQDVATQKALFTQHKVKVFLYNQQVTDSLTESYIKLADENGIPVVGVYETMPTPGYTYQSWMLAEVNALNKAVTSEVSTEKL